MTDDGHDGRQRYRCGHGHTTMLPEAPSKAPDTVMMGCDECGRLRTWLKMGGVASQVRAGVGR